MKKITLFFFLSVWMHTSLWAQCESCPATGQKSDYCYQDKNFPGYCVAFTADKQSFVLLFGKKQRELPLADVDSLNYFISLAGNKSYKLTATEVLLIQEALQTWDKEKRDIGMMYTESGLGYKIIQEGSGNKPEDGQVVKVHYRGTLEDGKQFDSSYDRGQPIDFPLGQGRVIKGWDEGIKLLSVGTKAILKIPATLGYGERGAGGVIPPNATLYFEVELVAIE